MSNQQIMVPRESACSLLVEMLFHPDGPDGDPAGFRLLAHGSAFAYTLDGVLHLITARHNLTGRHWQTHEPLGKWPVSPTHLRVTWLTKPPSPTGWPARVEEIQPGRPRTASASIPMCSTWFPLVGQDDLKPLWREHPEFAGRMDVAAMTLEGMPDDILVIAWENASERTPDPYWPLLAPGQDVIILGYPYKLMSGPVFPLWIRGMIASHPGLSYRIDGESLPLFLVDARTRTGQSGSAVIRHRPDRTPIVMPDGNLQRTIGAHSELLGIYTGRTRDESDLGFVWPLEYVDVICRSGAPGTGTF